MYDGERKRALSKNPWIVWISLKQTFVYRTGNHCAHCRSLVWNVNLDSSWSGMKKIETLSPHHFRIDQIMQIEVVPSCNPVERRVQRTKTNNQRVLSRKPYVLRRDSLVITFFMSVLLYVKMRVAGHLCLDGGGELIRKHPSVGRAEGTKTNEWCLIAEARFPSGCGTSSTIQYNGYRQMTSLAYQLSVGRAVQ